MHVNKRTANAVGGTRGSRALRGFALTVLLVTVCGCGNPGAQARLTRENMSLREDKQRLERTVGRLNGAISGLKQQVDNLKGFDANEPADLFAPVRIEIVSLSGGTDFDDKPGHDGVTVYLRPRDRDGDAVKVPGRIRIQLTDNSVMGAPRLLGVYRFDDPDDLRKIWHSRFGTMHFALKCPFPPHVRPRGDRVTINAEFTDYLTGRTLTAAKEVTVLPAQTPGLADDDRFNR